MELKIKLILFFLITIWAAGVFIEFIIPHFQGALYFYPAIYKSYSLVCHQDTCKLITLDGHSTMVCSRCTGIYAGLLISSVLSFFLSIKKRMPVALLVAVMLPMLLDVVFYSMGFYEYSKSIAFLTGFLLGSVGFFYLYYGIENLIEELKIKSK